MTVYSGIAASIDTLAEEVRKYVPNISLEGSTGFHRSIWTVCNGRAKCIGVAHPIDKTLKSDWRYTFAIDTNGYQ